jgi:hypothetical protein
LIGVRNATPEECADFGNDPCLVNWLIMLHDRPAVLYQAFPDPDIPEGLEVHVVAKRHTLHPALIAAYAKTFADQLLTNGATALKAEVAVWNRASLRVAKAAGFIETERDSENIILRRKNE